MATSKPAYRPLSDEEDNPAQHDDAQDRHPQRSRRPNPSTIVLSITTVIFGLHSIYLSLQNNCTCLGKEELSFDAGYATEWGPKSPLLSRLQHLISV